MGWVDRLLGREPEEEAGTVLPAPPTEADVLASLDRVRAQLTAQAAPAFVAQRVARVDRLVRETLPRLPGLGLGSADAYAVVATATSYLPEAVDGYLRLPRDFADTRPIDGGRTALMVLIDQLELLGATMARVLDAAVHSDAQALIAHGRFLEAKFHPGGGGLDLDAAGGSGPGSPGGRSPGTSAPSRSSDPVPGGQGARSANSLDLEP